MQSTPEAVFSPKQMIGLDFLKVDALDNRRALKRKGKENREQRVLKKRTSKMRKEDLIYPMH